MKNKRTWLLEITLVSLILALLGSVAPSSSAQGQAQHVGWDIVNLIFGTDISLNPGGVASALANDSSKIVLTGAGTFVAPAGGSGTSSAVTGGGTWETFNPSNVSTGNGTYWVTGLVRWDQAPGFLPTPPFLDKIGNPAEWSAGLAILRIQYSDGERGILVVSCQFVGTPRSVFEGITASKGFVDYFNRVAPGFTLFHVRQ